MSTELKKQVENAASANDLACGHKGRCKTCPICIKFNDDGFGEVKQVELDANTNDEVFDFCLCIIF